MKRRLALVALALALSVAVACSGPVETPVPVPAGEGDTSATVDCAQGETQAIAQDIAEQYGVSYDQVISWVCSGQTLDDILLALQTSKLTEQSADQLLALKAQAGGWDPVWEKLGLVSR